MSCFLFVLPLFIVVNYCVCMGCTNTNRSGHGVLRFAVCMSVYKKAPTKVRGSFIVKRCDFTATSVMRGSAVVRATPFKQKYHLPVTPTVSVTNFALRFQNKNTKTNTTTPEVEYKHIIMKVKSSHYFPAHWVTGVSNMHRALTSVLLFCSMLLLLLPSFQQNSRVIYHCE